MSWRQILLATLWIHPETGQPYILVMHESLYFGDRMGTTLICPNQVSANGIKVEDVPRQFDSLSSHSIFDPKSKVRKLLSIEGVASGFVSRKPTLDEYEEYEHIELSSPITREPSAGLLAEKESRVIAHVSVAQDESASGYARNATRQASAMQSIAMMTRYIMDEDDDLADRAVVYVASNDEDGDGLAGRQDPDLFPWV